MNIKDYINFGATSLTFSGAGATAVSGSISGAGALIVNAAGGSVTLSGSNSIGGVTLTAGTLNVNNAAALGSGSLTINGGTLDNTSAADIVHGSLSGIAVGGNFAYAGTRNLTLANSGALTVAAPQTITVSANTLTLGGSLSTADLQNITKAGAGTLVLAGAVTLPAAYTTSISAGTLQIDANQALGANQAIDVGSGTLNLAGVVSNAFGLAKSGAGTLVLSNAANTYTGATTLNAGVLNVGTFANGGSNSSIGASSNAAGNLVLNGGTLQYTGAAAAATDRLFTLGAGTAAIDSSSATAANTLQFTNAGAIAFAGSGARTLELTGSNFGTGSGNWEWNGVANIIAAVIGDGPGGATSITKTGTGRWALSGSNTYTGGTTVSAGQLAIRTGTALGTGDVSVAAGAQLAFSNVGMTVANNITLNGLSNIGGNAGALIGDNLAGGGVNTLSGTLTLAATSNLSTSWSDKSLNVTGKVTGPGGLQVDVYNTASNASVISLSNTTNDYAGGTILNGSAGKLVTLNANGLGTLSTGGVAMSYASLSLKDDGDGTGVPQTIVVANPITLAAGTDNAFTVGRLGTGTYYTQAANKTMQLNVASAWGANTLTVTNNNGYGVELPNAVALTGTPTFSVATATASNVVPGLTVSGAVSGAFGLVKTGAGTLVLANAGNTFGGVGRTIDIQGGVVAVASDAALGDAANTIVLNANATTGVGLRATGTFATNRSITLNQASNAIEVTGGNTLTLNTAFVLGAASNGLAKNDNGILEIAVANPTWTGPITINAGAVRTGVANALGGGTITVNNVTGAALQLTGGVTVSNPITLLTGSNVTVSGLDFGGAIQSVSGNNTYSGPITQASGAATLLGADAGATLNITGGITTSNSLYFGGAGTVNVSTTALTNTSALRKIGAGTTNLSVASPAATGAFEVAQGTFVISGAGSLGGTGAVTVDPGATLVLDSSGATSSGRLSTRAITLDAGNFVYVGNVAGSSETYGALTLATGGGNTITSTPTGSGTIALTFASLTQNADSSFVLAGTNVGTADNKILFTTAPTTVPATSGILARGIVTAGGGFDFVSYNHNGAAANTNGLQAFTNYNATSATDINSAAATDTVNVNAGMTTSSLTASKTLNAVKLTGTGQTLGGAAGTTLTLTSGGIANTGGVNAINVPIMAFGGTQAIVHVDAASVLNLNGAMTGTAGLVKADGGTLVLNPPATAVGLANAPFNVGLTGTHTIAAGTLQLGVNNAITVNSFLRISAGGTLDLNGKAQFIQALYHDRTFGTDGNSVEGAGGTVTGTAGSLLVANYDNTARQWAGTITGAVSFAREGQNTQVFYADNDYSGSTLLNGGTTTLRDGGRLSGTSSIDINHAALTLDNAAGNPVGVKALADRINDAATISLRGGTLTLLGRAQTDVTETVGAISLVAGRNVVDVQTGGTNVNSSVLTAASLARPLGSNATVILGRLAGNVDQNGQLGSAPRMLITAAPTLSNDIIGPWAIISRDWASYGSTLGVGQLNAVGFKGYTTTPITASPLATDNIRVTAGFTLANDTTVNTLNLTSFGATSPTINLGAKTLTLAGGGLMIAPNSDNQTATVSNGTITSGFANGSVNDLYLYHLPYAGTNRQSVISAAIANNGGTPVRLVITSSEGAASAQRTTLTGSNTYTGGTVINGGTVVPGTGGVIPAGGITINAGMLDHAPGNQTTPLGVIDPANVVTLNGPAIMSLVNDNTLAGLVFNNEGGGASAPTVNTFKAGQGVNGTGTLTIGSAGITASSSNVSSTAIIVGRIDTGAAGNTITVNPVTVNGVAIAPLSPTLAIQGWSGSAGAITKAGNGVLQLNAQQTFTGTLNVTAGGVGFGTLGNTGLPANNAAGSRFARIDLGAGTFLNMTNTDLTIGSLSGSGVVFNQSPTGTPATGRTFNVGFDGTNSTFAGSFSRYSDQLAASYQVNKIGGGTMTLTGVSTVAGGVGNSFQVAQGGVTFAEGGSTIFGTYYILPTGTLTLNNSTTNVNHRLTGGAGSGGTLNVAGGTLRIVGNAAAATNETIGTLNLSATGTNLYGPSVISLEANAGQPLTLSVATSFAGLAIGSSSLIRGVSATAGPGLANLSIGTLGLGAPTGAGTGANGTTTMPIRPDILGDASPTGVGTGFVTKDTATSFLRPLTSAELATTVFGGLNTPSVNYGLSAVAALPAGGQFGSLTLQSGGGLAGVLNSDGLPINPQVVSGGILAFAGNAGLNAGRLQTANNTAFYFHTVGDLTVGGVLNGTTGGLLKADAGNLTINSKAVYTGQTNITGGTLTLNAGTNTLPVLVTAGAPTALSTGVHAGTLDLNGNNQMIGTLFNTGNGLARYANNSGTVTNTSGTTATLTVNQGTAIAFGGDIAGNLNLTKTGNNALTLSSVSAYTGVTTVRANTLNLVNAGALPNTSAVNLNYGGLNLDNSGLTPLANAPRLPAAAPVNLRGGTLTMTSGGSVDTLQTINTVNVIQGHNTISVPQAPISGIGILTVGNLAVTPDATVNFTGGNSSGYFSSGFVGYNNSQVLVGSINGAPIPATIDGKILGGWALVNNGEFATYLSAGTTGSNGLTYGISTMNGNTGPLGTYTQNRYDVTSIAAAGTATTTVRLGAAGTLVAGGTTYNCLAVRDAAYTITFSAATDVLNLASGGLALTNGGTTFGASVGGGRLTSGGANGGLSRLYIYQAGNTSTVNTIIQDNGIVGASTRLVVTTMANQLNLAAANTYTGGTVINGAGGGVTLTGAAGTVVIPAGGVTINNATLTMSTNAGQIAASNDVILNGGGSLTLVGSNTLNSLTFNNVGGTATPTVATATALTLTGASVTDVITAVNDNAATVPTISGTLLTLPAGANINASTTALVPTDLVISAPIATATAGGINKTGSGSLLLSGQSTFSGGVNLNAGTIILGANSTPTTGTVTTGPLGTGTLTMADGTALISDTAIRTVANAVTLNGNITFGSTAGIANASTVAVNGVILNGAVNLGAATRTIDVNSFLNTTTLGGVVSGAAGTGLTKTGPGTLVLSVANSFDGPVTINGGTLSATVAGSLGTGTGVGNITFGGGILQHGGTNTTDYSNRFSTANNQPILIDTGSNTVTYATALTSATGGLLGKFGSGTLILTAAANYDGATLINAGTLQVGTGGAVGSIPAASDIYDAGTLLINRQATDVITHSGNITGGGGITIDQATFTPTGIVNLGGNLGFGSANGTATIGALDLTSTSAVFGGVLVRTNNATANTVTVGSGQSLSINGNVTLGYDAGSGTGARFSNLTVSGAGSMSITGATITVSVNQAATNAAYFSNATLDVSALGSFSTNVTTFNIGVGTTTQGPGTVLLSNTANNIVATTLTVGDTGANNGQGTGTLVFGTGANVVQADTINIGRGKNTGPGMVKFASQAAGSPGTVVITDKAGTGAANITVGDNNGTATAGGAIGTLDLRGHVATVTANTLLIGRNNMGSNTGGVTGTVYFDGGAMTVNTINMAAKSGAGTGSAVANLNVSGCSFTVNPGGSFTLASQATAGTAAGTLNVTGGVFTSNADIVDGGGAATTTVTLNGGTLDMAGKSIGLAGQLIDGVNLQSGTLKNLGQLNNGAVLNKTTAGTLVLDGTNAYTGGTTVTAGRLTVAGSALNTAGASVLASATLELARPGSLSATAAGLDIANAGTLEVSTLAQTVGDITGTGTTDVKASSSLTANSIVQDTLTIGAGGSVTIREVPVAAAAGAAGASAVPEPSTWLLLLAGGLCLAGWLRRRHA